jgi:hypothetical protein
MSVQGPAEKPIVVSPLLDALDDIGPQVEAELGILPQEDLEGDGFDLQGAAAQAVGQPLAVGDGEVDPGGDSEIPPSPIDWKPRLDLDPTGDGAFDPLLSRDGGPGLWTKFTITADDAIFYQNANKYVFHYDFATQFLPQFKGMTPEQFNAATLGEGGEQQALLGTVIRGGTFRKTEVGISLVSKAPLSRETVLAALQQAKASMDLTPGTELFYFPTDEQKTIAATYAADLAAAGFPVGSTDRWARGNEVYADGWALGKLKFFPSTEIEAAYARGDLTSSDILLTDGVPAEIPHVAGIISLASATPASHVAILSRSFGVPFAYAREEDMRSTLQGLLGKDILVRAHTERGLKVDAMAEMDPAMREQVMALKAPPQLNIKPMASLEGNPVAVDVKTLDKDSTQYVGGKANGYGLLMRTLPLESAPKAMAFTFELWKKVMDVEVESTNPDATGKVPLGMEIAYRLKEHGVYPPKDIQTLKKTLADIRLMIAGLSLPADIKAVITQAIQDQGFTENRGIRFRSSTNVEDNDDFSGAGLYESYTGWVKPREGKLTVFQAILNCFASFYFDNAYLERVRHGVNEADVGMAMLAHYNYPDKFELSNGVATVELRSFQNKVTMVSQVGDESVTNPDPDAPTAEVVEMYRYRNDTDPLKPYLQVGSSMVPVGGWVMEPEEYQGFGEMLLKVAQEYVRERGITGEITLDFEYKKMAPLEDGGKESLVIKQVRPIPEPKGAVPVAVAPGTEVFETFQGEYGSVFANHALKTRMTVTSSGGWLGGPNAKLDEPYIDSITTEYVKDGKVVSQTGTLDGLPGTLPGELPGHQHSVEETEWDLTVKESWDGELGRQTLHLGSDDEVHTTAGPLVPLDESRKVWEVNLTDPPMELANDWVNNTLIQRPLQDANVTLVGPQEVRDEVADRWNFDVKGEDVELENRPAGLEGTPVLVQPRYRYAKDENMFVKTWSLGKWEESTITGLTTEPLKLKGYFSQTMRPGHHNFNEDFIFEPRLEEGISEAQLEELEQQDIVQLYVDGMGQMWVCGKSGQWRELGKFIPGPAVQPQ